MSYILDPSLHYNIRTGWIDEFRPNTIINYPDESGVESVELYNELMNYTNPEITKLTPESPSIKAQEKK